MSVFEIAFCLQGQSAIREGQQLMATLAEPEIEEPVGMFMGQTTLKKQHPPLIDSSGVGE